MPGMKVSFDGARLNLRDTVLDLKKTVVDGEEALQESYLYGNEEFVRDVKEKIDNVSSFVNAFLCMYDENTKDDFSNLADKCVSFFSEEDDG